MGPGLFSLAGEASEIALTRGPEVGREGETWGMPVLWAEEERVRICVLLALLRALGRCNWSTSRWEGPGRYDLGDLTVMLEP